VSSQATFTGANLSSGEATRPIEENVGSAEPAVPGRNRLWTLPGYWRPLAFSMCLHLLLSLLALPAGRREHREAPRSVRFSSARLVTIVPPGPAAAARLRPAAVQTRPPESPPDPAAGRVIPKRLPPTTASPRTREKPRDAARARAGAARADAPQTGPVTGRLDGGGVVRSALPQVGDHTGALVIRADGEDLGYNYYFLALLRKIAEYWEPPPGNWGDEVAAMVRFTVLRDGSVPPVSVEEPSGLGAFDASAMRAVTRAAPLPPLPQEYQGEQIVFHLRFVYGRDSGNPGRNP
jgi:TonB family protein